MDSLLSIMFVNLSLVVLIFPYFWKQLYGLMKFFSDYWSDSHKNSDGIHAYLHVGVVIFYFGYHLLLQWEMCLSSLPLPKGHKIDVCVDDNRLMRLIGYCTLKEDRYHINFLHSYNIVC